MDALSMFGRSGDAADVSVGAGAEADAGIDATAPTSR
jgi:hypothetical protein